MARIVPKPGTIETAPLIARVAATRLRVERISFRASCALVRCGLAARKTCTMPRIAGSRLLTARASVCTTIRSCGGMRSRSIQATGYSRLDRPVATERMSHVSGGDLNTYLRLCSDKGEAQHLAPMAALLRQSFDPGERRRLGAFFGGVGLLHVAGWGLLLAYSAQHPAFLALGGLAHTFRLRPAFC